MKLHMAAVALIASQTSFAVAQDAPRPTQKAPQPYADFPHHDVDADCQGLADRSGANPSGANIIYNDCVGHEQLGYDWLKPNWSDIPVAIRVTCVDNKNGAVRQTQSWLLYYGLYECTESRWDVYLRTQQRTKFRP